MDKAFIAKRTQEKLVATEAAIDLALIETTQLLADLLQARADLGAPVAFADDVQVKLTETVAALSSARTAMGVVHSGLEEAALRLGIRHRMAGPYRKKDFELFLSGEERNVA
jgi:flagellin-like hook-associated protein FlgL